MKRKQKAATLGSGKAAKREAQRFLWHLIPPLRECYDHTHWWNNRKQSAPLAAMVWEIFRRHPDTYALFTRHCGGLAALDSKGKPVKGGFGSDLAVAGAVQAGEHLLLAAHFSDTWPKLSKPTQRMWQRFFHVKVKPQRGCHPSAVAVLNEYRKAVIVKSRLAKAIPSENRNFVRYMATLAISQPGDFLCDCEDYDGNGRIVIAIDPGAPSCQVLAVVKSVIETWPDKPKLPVKGKYRLADTLAVIAEFEQDVLATRSKQILKDQLFARYRRVIRPWFWAT